LPEATPTTVLMSQSVEVKKEMSHSTARLLSWEGRLALDAVCNAAARSTRRRLLVCIFVLFCFGGWWGGCGGFLWLNAVGWKFAVGIGVLVALSLELFWTGEMIFWRKGPFIFMVGAREIAQADQGLSVSSEFGL
jgi:hypothetical protein